MFIYLVRHLPTEYNRKGIYMGRSCDLPILPEAIEPFVASATKIINPRDVDGSILYSSPALRCRQTAEILSGALGISTEPQILSALDETNYGRFEGKSPQEIKTDYPVIYLDWMNQPSRVRFPDGETFAEVQTRAVACLRKTIDRKETTDSFFVVTHVDVIKMIVCWILEIPIDKKRSFCIDHGSFTCIEIDDENSSKIIKVRYLNNT